MRNFGLCLIFVSFALGLCFAGGRDRTSGSATTLITIPFIYNTVQQEMQGINSATSALTNMTNTPNINPAPLSSPSLYPEPTLNSTDQALEYLDYSQQLGEMSEEAAQYNEGVSLEADSPAQDLLRNNNFPADNYRHFEDTGSKK